jgi:hypothetical protein
LKETIATTASPEGGILGFQLLPEAMKYNMARWSTRSTSLPALFLFHTSRPTRGSLSYESSGSPYSRLSTTDPPAHRGCPFRGAAGECVFLPRQAAS